MGTTTEAEYYVNGKCKPGNTIAPTDCDWHPTHYWCSTCEGFYGVPHDGIHEGPGKHPRDFPQDCVCRVCQTEVARRRADRVHT